MFIDPIVFYSLFALGALPALVTFALGAVIARGRTQGGLTFCRVGRLSFSFCVRTI